MKSLRIRAILKSLGYKSYYKSNKYNGAIWYNKKLDKMVYLDLEVETYNHYVKQDGREVASRELFEYLGGI